MAVRFLFAVPKRIIGLRGVTVVKVLERQDAMTEFCRREHPRLVSSMTLYTGDADLAVELAQESLARACRTWTRVVELEDPGAWAHRVAVNLANSHFRRRRYEQAVRVRVAARLGVEQHDPDHGDAALIRSKLSALPARQKEALVLRYLLDLSVDMTATRMRCAPGTVRALSSQAIATLRLCPEFANLKEACDD